MDMEETKAREGAWTPLLLWTGAAVLLPVLITLWCSMRRSERAVRLKDLSRASRHRWRYTDLFGKPTYCCACELPVLHGAFCDCCGVCAHEMCARAAERALACKEIAAPAHADGGFRHHWVRGNVPLASYCAVCKQQCGTQPKLCDYR